MKESTIVNCHMHEGLCYSYGLFHTFASFAIGLILGGNRDESRKTNSKKYSR